MEKENPIIKDRYKIIKLINEESENTFLGEDLHNYNKVVIKKRNFKNISDWKVLELFEREIDTIRQIKHKRVPKYIDSFTIEKDKDTEYYLILEYIAGESLKNVVNNGRTFTETETILVINQILDVLYYLHYQFKPAIIHRDINPSNIIMAANQEVFLVDFGAVKDIIQYNKNNSTIVGTYGYMAVEQTMGKATASSDIYALGMTAIFLLTGKNPTSLKISRAKPDFRAYCDISPSFSQALDLMVEPIMEDRLQNIDEVYNELRIIKADRTIHPMRDKYKKNINIQSSFEYENDNKLIKNNYYEDIAYDEKDDVSNIQDNDIEDEFDEELIEKDPIFQNQMLVSKNTKNLEKYINNITLPDEFHNVKVWKNFDSMSIYFRDNINYPSYQRKSLSSTILLIPLIMLFAYIGMETFMEPFFIFAMILPLFVIFFRNIRTVSTNSIQLKTNYIKIVKYKSGKPESKIIPYREIQDIYMKEDGQKMKIIINLKSNKKMELDADNMKIEEILWIVDKCKEYMILALKN